MSIPVTTRNIILDGLSVDALSLHTAWPGVTGANEVSGGSPAYVRQSLVLGSASGGSRASTTPVLFDLPATTVRWVGAWNSGVFRVAMPNGGSTPKQFMALPSLGFVYATAHGYSDGEKIVFFDGTPPGGLIEGTVYFVRDRTSDSFRVAPSNGGVAITITASASFGCVVSRIVEQDYLSQSQHQISQAIFAIPD